MRLPQDPDWQGPEELPSTQIHPLGQGVGGRTYARWPAAGPWGSSLFVKDFGTGAAAQRHAVREFQLGARLRTQGAPGPRPWAVLNTSGRYQLLLQDCGPEARIEHADALGMPETLGSAAAAFHNSGAIHGDMHLGNLLRDPSHCLLWTDWRRVRFPGQPQTQRLARDLGWLLASLNPYDGRFLVRFARGYCRHLQTLSLSPRTWIRRIHEIAWQRVRDHHCNLDRRARRELSGPHPKIWRTSKWKQDSKELEDRMSSGISLKEGSRSDVVLLHLDDESVVLKHFRLRKPLDPRNRIGHSKALQNLFAAESLQRRGLSAAQPLATWSRPGEGSWLLLKAYLQHQPLHLAITQVSGQERLDLLREIARFVRRMHVIGVRYRDLKPSNLLVRTGARAGERLVLIDHDRNRFKRTATPPEVAGRDLAALHAGLPQEVRSTERWRALYAYDPQWTSRSHWFKYLRPLLREAAARQHRWQPPNLLGLPQPAQGAS